MFNEAKTVTNTLCKYDISCTHGRSQDFFRGGEHFFKIFYKKYSKIFEKFSKILKKFQKILKKFLKNFQKNFQQIFGKFLKIFLRNLLKMRTFSEIFLRKL